MVFVWVSDVLFKINIWSPILTDDHNFGIYPAFPVKPPVGNMVVQGKVVDKRRFIS